MTPKTAFACFSSSDDPELGRYLESIGVRGSTGPSYDDGTIDISIRVEVATKGTWLEELGHAKQQLDGFEPIGSLGDRANLAYEVEVAECLLSRAHSLRLNRVDIEELSKHFEDA